MLYFLCFFEVLKRRLFSAYYTSFCWFMPIWALFYWGFCTFEQKSIAFLYGLNAGTNFQLIIVTPNESMPFSAYYSSSRRSGHSRRFRITGDSGERNLPLEEQGRRPGRLAGLSGGGASRFGGKTWYFLHYIDIFAINVVFLVLFWGFEKEVIFRLLY